MISHTDQSEHSPGYQFIPEQKISEHVSKYDISLEHPQNSEILSMILYRTTEFREPQTPA